MAIFGVTLLEFHEKEGKDAKVKALGETSPSWPLLCVLLKNPTCQWYPRNNHESQTFPVARVCSLLAGARPAKTRCSLCLSWAVLRSPATSLTSCLQILEKSQQKPQEPAGWEQPRYVALMKHRPHIHPATLNRLEGSVGRPQARGASLLTIETGHQHELTIMSRMVR